MDDKDKTIDLASLFPPDEHGLYMYYGRIGQGKTYAMTCDVINALMRGKVVYTNFPINWQGFDELQSFPHLIFGILFLRRRFYRFPKENLHRIEVDADFHDNFSKLTDCIVALDEGYVVFDSYEMAKLSMSKRKSVLHTRHFDRSIWITAQRPTNVHVVMRSQVNAFYKVTKLMSWPFILFRKQELDMGTDETVDENAVFSTQFYLGRKQIFEAYNTKYLRYGARQSQEVYFQVARPTYLEVWRLFFLYFSEKFSFFQRFWPLKRPKTPAENSQADLSVVKVPLKDLLPVNKPLGVESKGTAIKNRERLNTVPVGKDQGSLF